MGNFSSCTSGFHPTSPPNSPLPPSPVARVLLVDGSVLNFRVPIKVIKLLLDYPHHFICPMDSLRPGHHSLSTLLPDEELQPGHLYLLLPFKTFENRQNMPMLGGGGTTDEGLLPARECGERTRLLVRNRSDVGYSRSDHYYSNSVDVGYESSSHGRAYDYSNGDQKKRSSMASLISSKAAHDLSHNSLANSRICDTPELQMAYRSVMLRKCRSWTPRLHSIKENKRVYAGSNS